MKFSAIILALVAVVASAYSQECGGTEFLCEDSGVCIPGSLVCDGIADCAGGSDEVDCPSTTTTQCPGFECPISGSCIPESWICDGYDDCGDYSDEEGCPCDGFVCDNEHCVPGNWVCDGWDDCGDNSDEQGCATTSTTPCPGFVCPNGNCIPESYICDGDNDCGDYSDESEEACPCGDDEVRCERPEGSQVPGACIPPEFICDPEGIWDCPDGSDEANCTTAGHVFDPKVPHYRLETLKAANAHKKAKVASRRASPSKSSHFVNRLMRKGAKL